MPVTIENVVVYSLLEVADLLGVNAGTVRHYVRGGRIRSVKIAGTILFSSKAVEEFMTRSGMEIPPELLASRELEARLAPAVLSKEEQDTISWAIHYGRNYIEDRGLILYTGRTEEERQQSKKAELDRIQQAREIADKYRMATWRG